ncbi:MAG: T9SS type A sorting domain-containing protein, partial [Paludibacteraceae bacterium]|nr:T9SS type A sorting domain-containing protein [Paludibacteraceae bacterium]
SPAITMVEGAQTYTATYSSVKNQYEVIFQNEDGTELQRSNVTYGETPKYNGETPTKAATAEFTYTFAGWSPAITMVEGAQTYTATYSSVKNQYEVIFQNEDGTELQRSNVTYGETPVYAGETPVKESTAEFTYTFAGWSPEISVVTGEKTYTATFKATKRKYTLTAKPQDDAMGTVTGSGIYEYGTKVTVKATKKYGYDFEKWDNGSTEPEITLEIVGDITLIALFTENYCEQTSTPSIPALEVLPVAVWESPLQLEEADAAIKAAIEEKQSEKTAEIKKTWWEVKIENEWEVYTSQIIPNQPTIQVRFALTTVCDKTAVVEATTITVERPTPENTKACNGAPSVNKYDWLLMLNVNELTAQGYEFNQQNVTWYKVAENDAQDQAVGKGFSYTIDRSLAGTGNYYALIDLPLQTNNVGCKGIYSTPVYDFTGKTQQRAMVVPSIVSPNSEVNVMNLPNEAAEVKVYDQVGKLYYIIQTQGEAKVEFTSQELPGKYIVEIQTATEKYSLKYIVR